NRCAFEKKRAESECFSHCPIGFYGTFHHLCPLSEQSDYLWIDVESARHFGNGLSYSAKYRLIDSGFLAFHCIRLFGYGRDDGLRTVARNDLLRAKQSILISSGSFIDE